MKLSRTAFVCLLLTSHIIAPGCVRYGANDYASDNGNSNSSAAKGELRSTPPYSTKEPERYRATLVTAGTLSYQSTNQEATQNSDGQNLAEQRMTIARDGRRRRTDYELLAGRKISLLQTPEGDYVIDASRKLYAALADDADTATAQASSGKALRDLSPDELSGKGRAAARYEKLGAETLNGRATTKYRVTPTNITGEATAAAGEIGESLIWIDDELHMPIKQEIISASGATNKARWWMELRDIETNVSPDSFEIRAGYRKVALQVLFPSNASAPVR